MYVMHTDNKVNENKLRSLLGPENDWSIVGSCRRQKFLLVFGIKVKNSTLLVKF